MVEGARIEILSLNFWKNDHEVASGLQGEYVLPVPRERVRDFCLLDNLYYFYSVKPGLLVTFGFLSLPTTLKLADLLVPGDDTCWALPAWVVSPVCTSRLW